MSLQPLTTVEPSSAGRRLPSGRSVVLRLSDGREELEVRSPDGALEVQVVLTDRGPIVRLTAARLEMETPDTVSIQCRRFEVRSTEETILHSDGTVRLTGQELQARTQGDIHMDGDYIRLNCAEVVPDVNLSSPSDTPSQ